LQRNTYAIEPGFSWVKSYRTRNPETLKRFYKSRTTFFHHGKSYYK
jgi:hypothetical protein